MIQDRFPSNGPSLLNVLAGVSGSKVAKQWSEFMRECLEHISTFLPSIKGIVDILGQKVLERYCRNGRLPNDVVDKIDAYEGFIADESLVLPEEDAESRGSESEEDSY